MRLLIIVLYHRGTPKNEERYEKKFCSRDIPYMYSYESRALYLWENWTTISPPEANK